MRFSVSFPCIVADTSVTIRSLPALLASTPSPATFSVCSAEMLKFESLAAGITVTLIAAVGRLVGKLGAAPLEEPLPVYTQRTCW